MRRIIEVSNEASPGTKENWYEVYIDGKDEFVSGEGHVATFHTRDELEIYLNQMDYLFESWGDKYKYELIPYESNE